MSWSRARPAAYRRIARRSSSACPTVSHTTVPDSSTHCISSGFSCSANGPSAAISSSGSTPDTRSKEVGSTSMYSSSTPTVSGGPSPKRWSSTLDRVPPFPWSATGRFYPISAVAGTSGPRSGLAGDQDRPTQKRPLVLQIGRQRGAMTVADRRGVRVPGVVRQPLLDRPPVQAFVTVPVVLVGGDDPGQAHAY